VPEEELVAVDGLVEVAESIHQAVVVGLSESFTKSDLIVRDGLIERITPAGELDSADTAGLEVVDGRGLHGFPGFVDPHVHLRTPGQTYKETLATGTAAGAAGGYTLLVAMPNTSPVVDSTPVLGALLDAGRREAAIDVAFTACITKGMAGKELTEMAALKKLGVAAFTDDGLPVPDAGIFRMACRYQKLTGMVLALHEEDPRLSAGGCMHEGAVSASLGLAGVPSISESTMIARDAAIALHEDARIHVQHLSARESIDAIRTARAAGAQVTCEASPHHLLLTDETVRSLDTSKKMNPPLRSEADRQALIDAVVDGTIDCIATDHAPHARDEKALPFEQAPMGTTGLETAFASVYTELVAGPEAPFTLGLLVEKLTSGAALLDLPTPTLAEGAPANLCLVDLGRRWTVGEFGYASKSANCCFHGRELTGKVVLTLCRGGFAFRDPSFAMEATR